MDGQPLSDGLPSRVDLRRIVEGSSARRGRQSRKAPVTNIHRRRACRGEARSGLEGGRDVSCVGPLRKLGVESRYLPRSAFLRGSWTDDLTEQDE